MNYRHAFHAGNFADVFKHTILLELLDHLRTKPAAFCYVDTHAGRGSYDLACAEATRTGEADLGIGRIEAATALPAALSAYRDAVHAFNGHRDERRYPGSPLLTRAAMRAHDRAIVCERQAGEAAALRAILRTDPRFSVHARDGYAALTALLPPAPKRGLVLIDPPFEAQADEYASIQTALGAALTRWPLAIYAIWFPIKRRATTAPFERWLRDETGARDVLIAELLVHTDDSPLRLNGCGMAIINAPWQFDRRLDAWLPSLPALLAASDASGGHRIDWLRRS